ncbi:hypothetical protein EMCLV154R [Equine molluscum contagiosum-like virus]|nr:hypothetical protein EMCLV154R [Equine molluscum contagiosum-like virus]
MLSGFLLLACWALAAGWHAEVPACNTRERWPTRRRTVMDGQPIALCVPSPVDANAWIVWYFASNSSAHDNDVWPSSKQCGSGLCPRCREREHHARERNASVCEKLRLYQGVASPRHNGFLLPGALRGANTRALTLSDGDQVCVRVPEATADDAGTYVAEYHDSAGSQTVRALKLTVRPRRPQVYLQARSLASNEDWCAVLLSCWVRGLTRPAEIFLGDAYSGTSVLVSAEHDRRGSKVRATDRAPQASSKAAMLSLRLHLSEYQLLLNTGYSCVVKTGGWRVQKQLLLRSVCEAKRRLAAGGGDAVATTSPATTSSNTTASPTESPCKPCECKYALPSVLTISCISITVIGILAVFMWRDTAREQRWMDSYVHYPELDEDVVFPPADRSRRRRRGSDGDEPTPLPENDPYLDSVTTVYDF